MAEPAKYRILHELGAGGMGTVYKGLLVGQAGFQRPIVIKQLKHPRPEPPAALRGRGATLRGPRPREHRPHLRLRATCGGELCIILEYIDGWSLVEYLERHRELRRAARRRPLGLHRRAGSAGPCSTCSRRPRIVHRDISPSNIMMTREGTVKLIDFGIATRSGTRDSSLTGKPVLHGAGDGGRAAGRPPQRPLQPGHGALRDADRRAALPGRNTTAEILEQVVAGAHPLGPRPYNPTVPRRRRGHPATRALAARSREALRLRGARWARPASTSSTTRATDPRTSP